MSPKFSVDTRILRSICSLFCFLVSGKKAISVKASFCLDHSAQQTPFYKWFLCFRHCAGQQQLIFHPIFPSEMVKSIAFITLSSSPMVRLVYMLASIAIMAVQSILFVNPAFSVVLNHFIMPVHSIFFPLTLCSFKP